MREPKQKFWRDKVTAEITLTHLQEIAQEAGAEFSAAETAAFLNQGGLAQGLWIHMMRAGEEYLRSRLRTHSCQVAGQRHAVIQAATIQ